MTSQERQKVWILKKHKIICIYHKKTESHKVGKVVSHTLINKNRHNISLIIIFFIIFVA